VLKAPKLQSGNLVEASIVIDIRLKFMLKVCCGLFRGGDLPNGKYANTKKGGSFYYITPRFYPI